MGVTGSYTVQYHLESLSPLGCNTPYYQYLTVVNCKATIGTGQRT